MEKLKTKTKEHHAELCRGLEEAFIQGKYYDVSLKIDDQLFPCHKIVLSAVSDYFKAMFSSGFRESTQEQVEIKGVDTKMFQDVLSFIYSGRIILTGENAYPYLDISTMFQIGCLQNVCKDFLKNSICSGNCIGIWRLASLNSFVDLTNISWTFIVNNFQDLCKNPEFLLLEFQELIQIITDPNLLVNAEEEVCEAVWNWFKFDQVKREKHIYLVFQNLYLSTMDLGYLVKMKELPDLKLIPACLELINDAINMKNNNEISECVSSHRQEEVLCIIGLRGTEPCPHKIDTICYSFRRNVKFNMTSLPSEIGSGFSACKHGNNICLSGGYNEQNLLLYLNTFNGTWQQCRVEIGRWSNALVAIGDGIFLIGGLSTSNEVIDNIDFYNPKINKTTSVGNLLIPVSSAMSATVDSNIYILGGKLKDRTPCSKIQCFNTLTNTCDIIGELPESCLGIVGRAISWKKTVFIVYSDGQVVQLSSSKTNVICRLSKMDFFGTEIHEGKILVVGRVGYQTMSVLIDTETHDVMSFQQRLELPPSIFWCLKIMMPTNRICKNKN